VSVPLRSASSPVQAPTTISVSAVALGKPLARSPGSPAHNPGSPARLQVVGNPNIKQVKQLVSPECLHRAGSWLWLRFNIQGSYGHGKPGKVMEF